jgi:hypothetical protein
MKAPIRLNSKGNEVIAWCLVNIRSCFFLSNHCRYMCCCHWCLLHHIYVSRFSNDKIHQSMEVMFGNKNIHLLLGVAREKVGDLSLNMCSTFQSSNSNSIPKCAMSCVIHSFSQGHQNKWIFRLSMIWSHWHCKRWVTIGCGKPRRIHSVVRKWVDNKRNAGVIGRANN